MDGINGSGNETKEGQVAGARVFYPRKLEPVVKGEVPTEDSLPSPPTPTTGLDNDAAKHVTDDTGIIKMHVEAPRIGGDKKEEPAEPAVEAASRPPAQKSDDTPRADVPEVTVAPETSTVLSGLPKGPYKVDTTEISLVVRDADAKAIAVIPHPNEPTSKNLANGVVALAGLNQKLAEAKTQLVKSLDEVEASLAHMNEALGGAFPELSEDSKAKLETMKKSLDSLDVDRK